MNKTDENIQFNKTILFISFLRKRCEDWGLNLIDEFRTLEMYVRRGHYAKQKED